MEEKKELIMEKSKIGYSFDLDRFSKLLGFSPEQTFYVSEYCMTKDTSFLPEPRNWLLGDTWTSYNYLTLAGKNSKILTLPIPEELKKYLRNNGFMKNKPLEVCGMGDVTERSYPYGSVIGQMLQKRNDSKNCQKIFNGGIIMPSFVSKELQELKINTLYSSEESIKFNSKIFIKGPNGKEAYNQAPGVIIESENDLSIKIKEFEETVRKLGIENKISVYVKISEASGGGTKKFESIDVKKISEWIKQFRIDSSIPKETKFLPIVIELDLAKLPDATILQNFGVQAFIGKDEVFYLGSTIQIIENSEWEGAKNISTEEDEKLLKIAEPEARKVFEKFKKSGYRGFMGVDVMVVKEKEKEKAYIIEANCRVTGATPLLSISEKIKGTFGYAELMTIPFDYKEETNSSSPKSDKGIAEKISNKFFSLIGNNLFTQKTPEPIYNLGTQTNIDSLEEVEGIVPFAIDVFPKNPEPNLRKGRVIIFGKNKKKVDEIKERIKSNLSKTELPNPNVPNPEMSKKKKKSITENKERISEKKECHLL
jgi:hypothetical protein